MFEKGQRIELVKMGDDPCPIAPGTRGTVRSSSEVTFGGGWTQVSVDWDNGRSLMLTIPPDVVRVVSE